MLPTDQYDIHRLKQLELACQESKRVLEESNKNLMAFAHMVAHEFKEPLHIILGFCTLIRESDFKSKETSLMHLNRVSASAMRLNRTIESLLAIARVNGSVSVDEDVDLNACVQIAIENLRAKIESSNARVVVKEMPLLRANRDLIIHLLQNLVGNAVKFRSAQTPEIKISAEVNLDAVKLSVADNGIGIDQVQIHSVFDHFKRLHSREKYEGTGLGLAICKRITELHGGRIWAESILGMGSTFFVEFPSR